MEVTLKRGAELARAALEAAGKVPVRPVLSASIYTQTDLRLLVNDGAKKLNDALNDVTSLLNGHFAIRAQIGQANAEAGINGLMADRARIEAIEKKMAAALALCETNNGETDLAVLRIRIAAQIKQAETGTGYSCHEGEFAVSVVSPETLETLRDSVAGLRRSRSAIQDHLAALNLRHRITLSPETLAVLTKFNLV